MKLGRIAAGLAVAAMLTMTVHSWEKRASDELVNRFWIERMPRTHHEIVGHFTLVEHEGTQVGGIGRSSTWRHALELFGWVRKGSTLELFFPQDRVFATATVRTWRCEADEAPPFELCMRITGKNGRALHYYSREDWTLDSAHAWDELAEAEPELAGVVAAASYAPAPLQAEPSRARDQSTEVELTSRLYAEQRPARF